VSSPKACSIWAGSAIGHPVPVAATRCHGEFSDLSILSHDQPHRPFQQHRRCGSQPHLPRDTLLVHTSGTYTVTHGISPTRRSTRAIPYNPTAGTDEPRFKSGRNGPTTTSAIQPSLGVDYMSHSTMEYGVQVVRQTPNVQNGGTQILFNPGHRMSFANTGLFAQAIGPPPLRTSGYRGIALRLEREICNPSSAPGDRVAGRCPVSM